MSAKTYLRILQGGLIASLTFIFFVFPSLLFPFITSKQLSFNILMEVLLAVWLVFIMRYPEYRPKKNLITYGLLAYFLAILASCFVSVSFNLSFWGDAERMLGLFHLLHFFIFYIILVSVFRTWGEWKALLLASVVVATFVSLFGLTGKNAYSTIGNTAYVSGYLIFNLYFAVILFFRSKNATRWLYLIPLLIMGWEFVDMRTSGAIIGLSLSILLALFLLGLSHVNKKVRRWSLIIFVIAVIAVIGIFSQQKTAWFQKSFLRNLTTQKTTFQTRLISWRGAAADFKYHPLLGTGFGNYAVIFDKHFDPKFFDYMKTETYFDRAHNNLIDITSTTGLIGLITYLSIFVAALYYLWRLFKLQGKRSSLSENGLKNLEIIILISLMAAYFVQNLAIFDSFVTYIGCMILLGFTYWLYQVREKDGEELEARLNKKHPLTIKTKNKEILALVIFLLITYIFTSQYNIKPWRMFQGVITGYSQILQGDLLGGVEIYKTALVGTPLDYDGRTTLINLITSNPEALNTLSAQEVSDLLDYVIFLAQQNTMSGGRFSLSYMQLSQVYDAAARYYYSQKDQGRFSYFSNLSMAAIDKSIEYSPRRIPVYLIKAQYQLMRSENEEAVATINYASSLNPNYVDPYCRLAQFYVFLKDEQALKEPLNKCVDLDGLGSVNSPNFFKTAVTFYAKERDFRRALPITEHLTKIFPKDAESWLNLAKVNFIVGNKEAAKEAVRSAVAVKPEIAEQAQVLINTMDLNTSTMATSTGN